MKCWIFFLVRYAGSSYYGSPITSYSSPFAGDIISSGHPSIEPYSAYHDSNIPSYAFDHHDHHEHHDFHDFHDHHDFDHHHDHHDFSQFEHGSPHDGPHDGPHAGPGSNMPPPASGDMKDGPSGSGPAMSPTYRRVGKHRRRRAARPQIE